MHLEDFPMDRQRCPLQIGSCNSFLSFKPDVALPLILDGYTTVDVFYKWTTGRGVNIAHDMKMSQFDLISTPTHNDTFFLNNGGKYSLDY